MRRAGFWATLLALGTALPAAATVAFAYRWEGNGVSLSWREPNAGPAELALRRQVGHWKRLAASARPRIPGKPEIGIDVSFTAGGESGGRPTGHLRIETGERTIHGPGPITEERMAAAIWSVAGKDASNRPADDSTVCVSPNGQWVATVSWRSGEAEVWAARRDGHIVLRVPTGTAADPFKNAIPLEPVWSPHSKHLAWIQGERLLMLDVSRFGARWATPPGRRVVSFSWGERSDPPLAVRYDDGTVHLLDLRRQWTIPFSDLLPAARPEGEVFWGPRAAHLMFRTRTRLRTADLSGPLAAHSWSDRLVDRLLRAPEPPAAREGEEAECIAVVDLERRRLDAYPLPPGPVSACSLEGATWLPDAAGAFAVGRIPGGPGVVLRVPVDHPGEPVQSLLSTTEPLTALPARPEQPVAGEGEPPMRCAILEGDRVALLPTDPDGAIARPYLPADMTRIPLRAGPEGGYRAGDSEVELEDEQPVRVLVEAAVHTGQEARVALPDGVLLVADPDSPLARSARRLGAEGAVDMDLSPEPKGWIAAAVLSPEGGAGRVVVMTPARKKGDPPVRLDLTDVMDERPPMVLDPEGSEFPRTNPYTGLDILASPVTRSQKRLLLLGAAAVLLLGALLAVRIVARRRRG